MTPHRKGARVCGGEVFVLLALRYSLFIWNRTASAIRLRTHDLKISTTIRPPESGSDPDGIPAIQSPVLNSSAFWVITRRSVV